MTYMNNTTTKNMKNKIITFSCSNLVHIYEPNSSLLPRFPFKSHKDIDSDKNWTNKKINYIICLYYNFFIILSKKNHERNNRKNNF